IYNGIDPTLYDDQSVSGFRASLNIPEKTKVIGMVANLIHYKGHKFFIRACAKIKSMRADVVFLLIGEGPMRIELEKLTKELGLEEDVVFLGRRSDISPLLSVMDVFVLTSLEEGFSNAILEAMAAGKPVIATDVGGNSEAVIHGKTGLLVPSMDSNSLADAINNMLCEPEMAEKMGEAGRERIVGEFSMNAMVRNMEHLYKDLIHEEM
ncbi:MAG: glycosyltransferase, partial [Thermodesulfobacteriota bacterium]